MQTIYQSMSDGAVIAVHQWVPLKKPKKAIIIVHGMAEHALRYDSFAEEACKHDFTVFAADLRGHGSSISSKKIKGYLADGDGFRRVVDDQKEIYDEIRNLYNNIPVIIIGHSFGSFVTQEYIENYGDTVKAAVLIGSSGPNPTVAAGSILADIICMLKGRKAEAKMLDKIAFGSYNKGFKNPKTKFDWLSGDENEVNKYINDNLCGFICTNGFYQDLMRGLKRLHKKENLSRIPVNLPILITAGSEDPVSGGGKTLEELYKIYQKLGIQDIELKLYKNARHEILNETNKEEVKSDIFKWMHTRV